MRAILCTEKDTPYHTNFRWLVFQSVFQLILIQYQALRKLGTLKIATSMLQ